MEVSNRYGVLESGDAAVDPENIPEGFAEKKLEYFIRRHTVLEMSGQTCIKKVAHDEETGEYIQLQAFLPTDGDYWIVQKFDNELVYMGEVQSGCKYKDEVLDWMRGNYKIAKGLTAWVYRSGNGDCTNGGISSGRNKLCVLSEHGGSLEPEDIRECVSLEFRKLWGETYVNAKPIYFPKRWYMSGGNFLFTSDSRFKEIAGISYPVSIHDRCEEVEV